jgi:GT2 family glycosyltransferase
MRKSFLVLFFKKEPLPFASRQEALMEDEASDILLEIINSSPPAEAPGVEERAPAAALRPPADDPRDCFLVVRAQTDAKPGYFREAVEGLILARGGGIMIVGWCDDRDVPLDAITISSGTWRVTFDARSLVRVRRPDVETALATQGTHAFGFFGLIVAPALQDTPDKLHAEIRLRNGGAVPHESPARSVAASELRDLVLGYLAAAEFFGNPHIEAAACLEHGLGTQIILLNREIVRRVTGSRHVERFGTVRRQPRGSIVVCLYGKAEFVFVQNCLFAGLPGIVDYEFVYVSNSPEIAETLLAEARNSQIIYGINQTVVLLSGNAGFGAANNAGITGALGRRVLIVNPDVFPRQIDWAARHTALCTDLPAAQTRLFGVPLYYDDGSLMHGGMYFEVDSAVSLRGDAIERSRMVRVEHYGKGAPEWSGTYVNARPVPAVTGAFMSAERAWFEHLGGFTEDYVFGHYEDADLCLKSLEQGTPTWLHDLRLWHLEGKGSIRRPHHEGGSLVNRWSFTRRWSQMIAAGLTGANPSHPLMAQAAARASESLAEPSVVQAPARRARAQRPLGALS